MDPIGPLLREAFSLARARGPESLIYLLGLCVSTMRRAEAALDELDEKEAARRAEKRKLTPKQAVKLHPVSLSFIYERGEELGFASRVKGTRKVVVDEAALLRVLGPSV